ncbi:isopentenyl transferase family protein [Pantoea stewartii]|uniref:Adenylate dimethylallyltransferase n=2 Tax=Pantoea stewartii TaxID=66269 RepID=A0ABN4Z5H4_PANSE|nr:isopentenyl transferase family protein [Pantoea stewartii]ARF52055.1 hypothetical protein DSJ_22575 [Pantoea stewartii subsp. stewartii DC283]
MRRNIYLLWGATTTGKTALSVSVAKERGWPVIALDRFQGYHEISTGSGAPTNNELEKTERIYITSQKILADGIISAKDYNYFLKMRVLSLPEGKSDFILEGGSVSVLKEMVSDEFWSGFLWEIKILRAPSKDVFINKAKRRITDMFHPEDGRPSIMDEVSSFFMNHKTIHPLEDIDGYRTIIDYCRCKKIGFDKLKIMTTDQEKIIISRIAEEYYAHALWQEQETPCIPHTWARRC